MFPLAGQTAGRMGWIFRGYSWIARGDKGKKNFYFLYKNFFSQNFFFPWAIRVLQLVINILFTSKAQLTQFEIYVYNQFIIQLKTRFASSGTMFHGLGPICSEVCWSVLYFVKRWCRHLHIMYLRFLLQILRKI